MATRDPLDQKNEEKAAAEDSRQQQHGTVIASMIRQWSGR
jgi:hypothetical protein